VVNLDLGWDAVDAGSRENSQTLRSEEISQDIEALEHDLEALRARVEKDSSSFATLEQEVAQLRETLLRTRESVAEHEARLADKQNELAEANRLEALEAYEDDVHAHHEAVDRVASAATDLLAALDAYDDQTLRLRQLGEQMRRAFGSDERVAEVESALGDEAARLRATSEAVLAATKWRLDPVAEEAAADPDEPPEEPLSEELSQDLQEIAQERRRARIKEYFGKT
jgi:predicted  nucleic acid-binding Zn-ribbon protein